MAKNISENKFIVKNSAEAFAEIFKGYTNTH